MSRRRLPLLVGVVTLLLTLVAFTGAAGAERIAFEPGGNITMSGPLRFSLEGTNVECNVTMRGSLTRELVSTASGTNLGSITEGSAACPTGTTLRILIPSVIVLNVILREAGGTVTGWLATIQNIGFLIETSLSTIQCLYGTELRFLAGTSGREVVVRYLGEPIPLRVVRSLNIFSCPGGTVGAGTWTMTPGQRVLFLPI